MKKDKMLFAADLLNKSLCEKNGIFYIWEGNEELSIVPLTDSEMNEVNSGYSQYLVNYNLENCKTTAKEKIALTDWSVLPDVNISNKTDFETYRATLRDLIVNPVADPVWPTEPQPVWV